MKTELVATSYQTISPDYWLDCGGCGKRFLAKYGIQGEIKDAILARVEPDTKYYEVRSPCCGKRSEFLGS